MPTAFQDLLYADGSGGGLPVEHELCPLALASDPSRSDEPNPSTSDEPTEVIDLVGDTQKKAGTLQPSVASLTGEYSLFDDIDGGSSPPVMDKSSSKMEPQKAPLAANHTQEGELKEVNRALNNHMSEVLTMLRETGANTSNITKIPKSLINPLREKTMTALRNADYCFPLSRALLVPEKDAILLYAEEVKKKKKEEKEEKKRQRLEAMKKGGTGSGGQLERKTKAAIASASGNKTAFPHTVVAAGAATSKRPRSGNENENGPTKKRSRKKCSNQGCTNIAQRDGVCKRHGAKHQCSSEGCTNQVLKGGVCWRHGAKVKQKLCKCEGCTNQAKRGGVCKRHGAKDKRCSSGGCTNRAYKGGVCKRHGAKEKRCSSAGCTNRAQKGGVCVRHGAKDVMKKT